MLMTTNVTMITMLTYPWNRTSYFWIFFVKGKTISGKHLSFLQGLSLACQESCIFGCSVPHLAF